MTSRPPLENAFEAIALGFFILSTVLFLLSGLLELQSNFANIAPKLQLIFGFMTCACALFVVYARICLPRCLRDINHLNNLNHIEQLSDSPLESLSEIQITALPLPSANAQDFINPVGTPSHSSSVLDLDKNLDHPLDQNASTTESALKSYKTS